MWQLVLLSQVMPAFAALAKEFVEREIPDQSLGQDARDCYSDIISICHAVYVSRGEWVTNLDSDIIMGALKALESRLPKRWVPSISIAAFTTSTLPWNRDDEGQFARLRDLSEAIQSKSLGGFDECFEAHCQSSEVHNKYLSLVGRDVYLFHKREIQSQSERRKFVSRVQLAGKHLLGVYYCESSTAVEDEFSLSQHPSRGIRELANHLYSLLERHWNCHCPQHHFDARMAVGREIRLGLIRHRQLAPKVTNPFATAQMYHPAKFEVLLPVAKEVVEWKVTQVEVKNRSSQGTAGCDRHPVSSDICKLLHDCDGLQIDFLAENDSMWHLTPKIPEEETNHHTVMESLSQLLGDGVAISDMAKYTPREKLTLCYLLANSMLFFYPGSWFQAVWSSTKVYFVRRPNTPTSSSMLTCPYLSVELQKGQQNSARHRMQYHPHPALLALGVILLEVATNTKFGRSHEAEEWKAINKDGLKALQTLQSLEKQSQRDRSKRISPALNRAIRSCLELKPPPNFPSHSLAQEGPIRHYILSCVLQPLAKELRDGYKIPLEELDQMIAPEKAFGDNELTEQQRREWITRRRSLIASRHMPVTQINGTAPRPPLIELLHALTITTEEIEATSRARHEEVLLLADGRDIENTTRTDSYKVSMAGNWFEHHQDATSRIRTDLRNHSPSDARKVKIAILDSGIHLSNIQKAQYGFDTDVAYRSFVDPADACLEWRDEVGHGTHLAVLLRKIAENSVIHIGRVFKKKPGLNRSVESIDKALRHAVDQWQVDIIVMSFGFGEVNPTLSEALDYVASKKVLMFAAASNDGKNRPDGVSWPASRSDVFCIHSADGYGNPSPFTPSPQDNRRITVLGECLDSAWPPFSEGSKYKAPGDRKLMSGTSCAAAIAAGIAAVVLDYARGFLNEEEWQRLRRYDSMMRVFDELRGKDAMMGYWWIKHWTLFDPKWDETWIQNTIRGFISI